MKTKILICGLSGLLLSGGFASCSSDYLEEAPIVSISSEQVGQSTQTAQMAVYGMCRAMFTQYQDTPYPRGMSGEGTINFVFNEGLGPDYVSFFLMREQGKSFYTWDNLNDPTNTDIEAAWMYCYNLINQANTLLADIGNAEGDANERDFIEAQARTFRAFGYIKAVQLFGPRWQDSNNGAKMAVVLRTEPGTAPAPLGSMKDVLDLVYSDLEKAESLFESCGVSRKNSFEPDVHVAYGLHARAALLRNDWDTAQAKAHKGREGMPLMSNQDLANGFVAECPGYLWTNEDSDIFYSSPGAWYACNGAYPANWGRGTAINLDLYNQLDPNDVRAKAFFTPDKVATIAAIEGNEKAAEVTKDQFWSKDHINVTSCDYVEANQDTEGNWKDEAWGALIEGYVWWLGENNQYLDALANLPYSMGGDPTSMVLGAGCKIWSSGPYGDIKYPYMRVAELIITEAEAAYMAGHPDVAKSCLEEINSVRIPGYTCTSSGEALLNEIRLCRRIELWGEGFNFTDFKRWNLPFEQRAFVVGDPTSGNCPSQYSKTHAVSDLNGWRLAIPQSESDFNPLMDRSQL